MTPNARSERSFPVAIVGAGLRLPGEIHSLDALQAFLMARGDAIRDLPPGRWDQDLFDPTRTRPGTTYVRRAGYVEGLDQIDAGFFGLSAHEASRMDPQQRLLLETAFEALEAAGMPLQRLAGQPVGVFVGLSSNDYMHLQTRDPRSANAYTNTGAASSIAANRLSYAFDFHGPSVSVDTACSSGLTALHLAVRALAAGDCNVAVVGAANALLAPEFFVNFCAASMLSPVGQCRAFDRDGAGFVRAEGAVSYVLKPLSAALADGDPILGVVHASGCNNDGTTAGISMPSSEAQAALLEQVYAEGGIDPDALVYVEAHGTGTAAGDPQEAAALGGAIGQKRRRGPLPIGSVKTNLGHLEPAAGLVGMAKVLAAFRAGVVAPQIHFDTPNPNIDFDGLGLRVVDAPLHLAVEDGSRIGVNSFGFGGANAHVVLGPAPVQATRPSLPVRQNLLFLISAEDPTALQIRARDLAGHVRGMQVEPAALAGTLLMHRTRHLHAAAFHASRQDELVAALDKVASGETADGIAEGKRVTANGPAFVFTGNGPQWFGMGRELMDSDALFRETVQTVSDVFRRVAGLDLVAEMARDEATSRMAHTDLAQPALFALQIALARCLAERGIHPSAVVGHSAGELAAAHVAGIFDLESIVRLVAARSAEQERTMGEGAMAALGLSMSATQDWLADEPDLVLAGENAPDAVTIAGEASAIDRVVQAVSARGVFARRLDLAYAFHSPILDRIETGFRGRIGQVTGRASVLPFYSSVNAARLDGPSLDTDYWWRNLRAPVLFRGAVEAMIRDGHRLFVEIGPHPALSGYVAAMLRNAGATGRVIASLRRGKPEAAALDLAQAEIAVAGAPQDSAAHFTGPVQAVPLPPYPWQRERHYHWPPIPGRRPSGHPLLGDRLATSEPLFAGRLTRDAPAFLADHVVRSAVLFPAAGFFELVLAAARTVESQGTLELQHVRIEKALRLDAGSAVDVQTRIDRAAQRVTVSSRAESADPGEHAFDHHVSAILMFRPPLVRQIDLCALQARLGEPVAVPDFYAATEARGLSYGPAFRTVQSVAARAGELLVRLQRQDDGQGITSAWHLDPTLVDGALQAMISFADDAGVDGLFLPVALARMQVLRSIPGEQTLWAHVVRRGSNRAYLKADITLATGDGAVVAQLQGMEVRRVGASVQGPRHLMHHQLVPVQRFQVALPAIDPASLVTPAMRFRFRGRGEQADRLLSVCDVLRRGFVAAGVSGIAGGAWFRVADLVGQGRLAAPHARYAEVMLGDAARGGVVQASEGRFRVIEPAPPWVAWRDAVAAFPGGFADLLAMARIGEAMTEILAGRETAQSVLFPGGGSTLMEQVYESGFGCEPFNAIAADVLTKWMERFPGQRRLRVLEIGAGTGGTTAHVLPRLARGAGEYVFTDLTAAFFPQAERRFGGTAHFRTRTLDISAPPDLDGLGGAFDVVVAANALHATPDLLATLRHVRQCLAPGGLLVLLETAPSAQFTYQFGLLTGFWAFSDARLRPETCVIDAARWREALLSSGFDAVEAVTEVTVAGHEVGSVLLARNPAHAASAGPLPGTDPVTLARRTLLVSEDGAPAPLRLAMERAWGMKAVAPQAVAARVGPHCDGVPEEIVYLAPASGRDEPIRNDVAWPLVTVVKALAASGLAAPPLFTLVTTGVLDGPANLAATAHWAVARTAANEYEALDIRRVDVAEGAAAEAARWIVSGAHRRAPLDTVDDMLVTPDGVSALTLGALSPEGVLPTSTTGPATEWCVGLLGQGSIDNAQVRALPAQPAPGPDEVEIRVEAAGLNFRDVILALGLLPPEMMHDSPAGLRMGLEAAGVVTRAGPASGFAPGDRVMTMSGGCFASSMVAPRGTVRRIPDGWSFEDAATVPVVGLTVVRTLEQVAAIRPGETLLVHGGAGGVGLTAIRYALARGVRVIATAGASEKRTLLKGLGVELVADSRSLSFPEDVLAATNGQGVDVILNSLAGESMHASLALLKPFGRFIEIGKRDFESNTSLNMAMLAQNITYCAVDLAWLLQQRPDLLEQTWDALETALALGHIAPLPRRVFPWLRTREALRHLQAGQNIGKVVLGGTPSGLPMAPAKAPRMTMSAEGAYIVTGGLGGLGLRVARWLVDRGARHLVLVGRSGVRSAEQEAAIRSMANDGAEITIETVDVADPASVESLVGRVRSRHGRIRGLVHSVLTLADSLITGLTQQAFEQVVAPKVQGALAFDRLLRDEALDLFVCFSSIANMLGNPGQANYVAANGVLEALITARRQAGQPGLALCLGPVSDAGFVARNTDVWNFEHVGIGYLTADEVLAGLDALLASGRDVVAIAPVVGRCGLPLARFARMEPVFRDARPRREGATDEQRIDLAALPAAERLGVVEDVLVQALAQVTGTSVQRIDRERSFAAAGLDSLMAVELGMLVEQSLGVNISLAELGKERSIRDHAVRLMDRLGAGRPEASVPAAPADPCLRRFGELPTDRRQMRIYAVHDVMGHSNRFADLAEQLSPVATLIGVDARGLAPGSEPVASHTEMVENYAAAIAMDAGDSKICLLGWSYGGIIANDVAHLLSQRGKGVAGLVVLDAVQDAQGDDGLDGFRGSDDLRRWGENGLTGVIAHLLTESGNRPAAAGVIEAVRGGADLDAVLDRVLGEPSGGNDVLRHRMRLGLSHIRIMNTRRVRQTFDGPMLLIRASDTRDVVKDPAFGWGTGRALQVMDVPAPHLGLLDAGNVPLMASSIAAFVKDLRHPG